MCWSCNPYCGGCKPPKPKPFKCPTCNTYCFPELKTCKRCGTVLPELPKPTPVMCLYIGKMCATPCNKHKKAVEKGAPIEACKYHTPLDDNND
ncbi:hypothetical protein FO488_01770 [Geobacter sp. FeAm09]|uniref:hypothetical protein n=1 Tax=Geobacter sp. FeAm09 TaxID=2597769 RepID=UPI0011ED9C45|nr:hypothetical protein [Geobacter sp. FeAm09]QEM67008.1 hypothetical protein FO488_01770 [Geobacter sp. FeAm09]